MKSTKESHIESATGPTLTAEHEKYLLERHGTTCLVPLPSHNVADPLNWPIWKKNAQILMVAFNAMITTFTAAAIIPAFIPFSELYHVSVTSTSYLTSVQLWKSNGNPCVGINLHIYCSGHRRRSGNRTILLSRTSAKARLVDTNDDTWDTWWPFIMGFVVQHLGVRWIFWILAIINMCQFIAYLFLGGETLYRPDHHIDQAIDDHKLQRIRIVSQKFNITRRIGPYPLTAWTFLSPFQLTAKIAVIVPACAYAIVFCYANIALIVEMPTIFGEKFHLNAQQIGLQFIALIVGSVLGEQVSGPLSDWAQKRSHKGSRASPIHRLWFSYVGFTAVIVGLLVWGIRIQQATTGVWNVTPLVGAAVAAFGNQIITTTLITYAVDCHRDRSMDIGMLINFIRQIWGFIGPFYLPLRFETLGFSGSAGLMVGIVVLCALLPVMALHRSASKKVEIKHVV